MEKALTARPRRLNTRTLGLLAASALFLVGGALLAVSLEGSARVVVAAFGFTGYLFFSSRAFRNLFPRLLGEYDPDPEREPARETSPARVGRAHITAA